MKNKENNIRGEYPDVIKTERLFLERFQKVSESIEYRLIERESGMMVGEIYIISGQVCYTILEAYRNQGFCTEALKEITKRATKKMLILVGEGNIPAQRVAEKALFSKESNKLRNQYFVYSKEPV